LWLRVVGVVGEKTFLLVWVVVAAQVVLEQELRRYLLLQITQLPSGAAVLD
jgi:hypothetical protein